MHFLPNLYLTEQVNLPIIYPHFFVSPSCTHMFAEKTETMQQILIDIKLNQLFFQCAEIVKQGEISIWNEQGSKLIETNINNNNYINIDINFPSGTYYLELSENGKIWKKNFKL